MARPVKRRSRSATRPKRSSSGAAPRFGNVFPILLSAVILSFIAALVYLGYRTVTASDFFEVRTVAVGGTSRTSRENIERLVESQTVRTGVWNADLNELRSQIEKMPFVRSASVSRVIPNGIRVEVIEHEPKAIVRLSDGDHLVGADGKILARANKNEAALPFVMTGWDESKSERADRENPERVKLYRKMLEEWVTFGIADRVKAVNISDPKEPRAVLDDSGHAVSIAVGRSNFGENLSRGIKAIAGKGTTFEAVDLVGSNMILAPRTDKHQSQKVR
ncbi:MAG TPA: FtsQ-type POTRA domain-containing protein [Pyrinomonadaceae bacterium]|nr:FtsQ-type POTRA domain-containing protein [Chloracidobacterium sp.]HRJ89888.1 FtsQ-type POTRA domain-containing protein [Pyrinomonadaceae bacterium]HRK50765.1 FtsQ-type POTRA domain-containing protein [Pyrinomonadaceae bacterium]